MKFIFLVDWPKGLSSAGTVELFDALVCVGPVNVYIQKQLTACPE